MSGVRKLVGLLARGDSVQGKVVSASETTLSVATRSGVVTVPRSTVTPYAVGDEVTVRGGAITGRKKDTSLLPRYYV